MSAFIVPATLRDLSYIGANLRQEDRLEIDAQLPGWTPSTLAAGHMVGMAFVVEWKGNPEAAFGYAEQRQGLWIAWSWGTRRMWRCVPAILDFYLHHAGPAVIDAGAWRVEARMLSGNVMAERFLVAMGATRRCELPGFGVHGEEFILWDWTRESWADVRSGKSRPAEAA
jgi:hypothetical protein